MTFKSLHFGLCFSFFIIHQSLWQVKILSGICADLTKPIDPIEHRVLESRCSNFNSFASSSRSLKDLKKKLLNQQTYLNYLYYQGPLHALPAQEQLAGMMMGQQLHYYINVRVQENRSTEWSTVITCKVNIKYKIIWKEKKLNKCANNNPLIYLFICLFIYFFSNSLAYKWYHINKNHISER